MTPQQQLEVDHTPATFALPVPTPTLTHRAAARTGAVPRFESHSRDDLQTIRVALAGCGVVGGGFVRLLHTSAPAIASRFGVRVALTRILVRDVARDRGLPLGAHLFTDDLDSFLDHDADVIIEAIGGQEPARKIAAAALARGRKVITANKELVAAHGHTLSRLARENDTGLDFGAAVGGSAPVISTLRDLVGTSTPRSIRGILNGTSNYIISQLELGVSLAAATASACERGLAEADCTRDLDGTDAAAKLGIIAWIAYGIRPGDLQIRRTPLIPGLEQLVRAAAAAGGRLRFIGECTQLAGDRVAAAVEPVIVAADSAFARTTLEENRVEVDLGWTSPLSVSGPGAGGKPTAAALLSDLLRSSPPPNDRGAGATRFVSVTDSRVHRWLVTARLQLSALPLIGEKIDFPIHAVPGDGACTRVITSPVSWNAVQRLIAELEALNAAPCIARYELDNTTEEIR
jgi:homoserine dehydrogenase